MSDGNADCFGKIICPDCDGEGRIGRMTWLSYDGDQTWVMRVCERCDGSGEINEELDEQKGEK